MVSRQGSQKFWFVRRRQADAKGAPFRMRGTE